MIQRLEIASVHYDLDKETKEYAKNCLGTLDDYMSKHSRDSAHLEVKLKGPPGRGKKVYTCEAILYMPHETLAVHEVDDDMRVAIDKAQIRLKQQLSRYKDKHSPRRGVIGRMLGR